METSVLVLLATFTSLVASSVAGYGGSLLLVPALAGVLGPKEGIALAALILGWNNVFKVAAYRNTLALAKGWPLLLVTFAGVWVGARLLITAPSGVVVWVVTAMALASFGVEILAGDRLRTARRRLAAPMLAASSVLSGFSGSSGPLKGIAVRSLQLPRLEHVGLASSISLVGDVFKVELFAEAGLLREVDWSVLVVALPAMPVAAWIGRTVNERTSEGAFRWVFWTVVGGYTIRMIGVWL